MLLTGGGRGADLRPALTRRSASCRAQHTMDHIVALCAQCALIPHSASPGYPPPPHGQLPCPLAVGCISNTPSQPVVSGSGSASSSCFCILFLYAQVRLLLCSLCFLHKYPVLCLVCSVFWASSHLQCSVPLCLCLSAFICYSGLSGSALGHFLGLTRQDPRRGGGSQQGSSPAC